MPDAKKSPTVRIPPVLLGAGGLIVLLGFGLPALVSPPAPQPAPALAPPAAPAGADAFAPRPAAPAPLQNTPGNLGFALVRLVVSLGVVCGGCVLVLRWLGKNKAADPNPVMLVVATLTVGRCAVHLVRAGDRRMLIGTDAAGVKALVELPGPDPVQEPAAEGIPDALPVEPSAQAA